VSPAFEGLRATPEGAVAITLRAPSASFLGLLAMPNAVVLPRGSDGSGTVSTGPWVLVGHVRDSHLKFRSNPEWHGKRPAFEEIRVRILPEEFTRVAEFEVGNLDVLEVPASASRRFRDDPVLSARVHRQVALVTEYVGLNNDDSVLSDPRVRRALNHAVNVDLILEKVLEGRGVRASGAIPPTLPGGGSGVPYPFDPDEARRLLVAANVPAGWTLQLWQRPSPLASQVLEAVQADLRRAGIAAEIRLRDWSALKATIDRGEAPSFFINWFADYPDPENFLVPLFHSRNIGGGGNRARFRDLEIDGRLEALDRQADPAARAAAARGLDADIHARSPWIYLWHPILEMAVSARVEGFVPHPIPSAERWLDVRPAAGPIAGDVP
jgi:ABC-type transport system substrate-binding protein